jgi:hypothetical protein
MTFSVTSIRFLAFSLHAGRAHRLEERVPRELALRPVQE